MRKIVKYGGMSKIFGEAMLLAVNTAMTGTAFSLYIGFKIVRFISNGSVI